MSKAQLFDEQSQSRSVLVDNYFTCSKNNLGDLIINARPNKVYLLNEFIARWKKIQNAELQKLSVSQRLVVFLVVNDLVFRRDLLTLLLPEIANRCKEPASLSSRISLSVDEDCFINIILSKATLDLIAEHRQEYSTLRVDVAEMLRQLDQWFWKDRNEQFVGTYSLVVQRFLPPIIFASVCGFVPYFSLPEKCFARLTRFDEEESSLVLADEPDDDEDPPGDDIRNPRMGRSVGRSEWLSVDRLFDYLLLFKKGDLSRTGLLEAIEEICALEDEESVQFLFLDWVNYMISCGSTRKSLLKPSTILQYSRLVFESVFQSLSPTERFEDWLDRLVEDDTNSLSAVAQSSVQQLKAALEIFNSYIADKHPAEIGLSELPNYESRTDANIVWSDEISRAITSARLLPDAVLAINCAIAIILAIKVRLRISELLNFRVGDFEVSKTEGVLLVTVRKSKSQSGQRTVRIPLDEAATLIEFLDMRISTDRADAKASLWGSYTTSEIHRVSSFKSHLNKILKLTTGDLSVSFHSLSHAMATSNFWALWKESPTVASHPNRIFYIAANFGHLSYTTTWSRYTHCVEYLIHRAVREMFASFPEDYLPSFTFRMWLANVSKNTFKSALARSAARGITPGHVQEKMTFGESRSINYPPFEQIGIKIPSLEDLTPLPRRSQALRPLDVFNICVALTAKNGANKADLANRFGIDLVDMESIIDELGYFGEIYRIDIFDPGLTGFRTPFSHAFLHSFRAVTFSMLARLSVQIFNPSNEHDRSYVLKVVTGNWIELSLQDLGFIKLFEFLKTCGVDAAQCVLHVGSEVPQNTSKTIEEFFRHTFLRDAELVYTHHRGKKIIRLQILNSSSPTKAPKRSGNRASITCCLQAALMCQFLIWRLARYSV